MIYKNLSHTTKTFYGVEFNPGDVKEVDGYINHLSFVPVTEAELDEFNKPQISAKKAVKNTPITEEVKSNGSNSDK